MCVHVPGIQPQTDSGPPDSCCTTGQKLVLQPWHFTCHPAAVKRSTFRGQAGNVPACAPCQLCGKGYLTEDESLFPLQNVVHQ